jgi:hypothetical protein
LTSTVRELLQLAKAWRLLAPVFRRGSLREAMRA